MIKLREKVFHLMEDNMLNDINCKKIKINKEVNNVGVNR